MRTNIDIDDELMAQALQAGPFTTKKDAVEAGLRLLARQAAYREILKWRGRLHWEGDESVDWTQPAEAGEAAVPVAGEPPPSFTPARSGAKGAGKAPAKAARPAKATAPPPPRPRRAGR